MNAGTLVVQNPNGIPNGTSLTVGAGAATLFGSPAAGGVVLGGAEVVVGGGNSAAAPSAVPEPGALALLLAGLGCAATLSPPHWPAVRKVTDTTQPRQSAAVAVR